MTPADFKAIRKSLGLSQSKLGEAINRDRRTIRRYEDGEWEIPPEIALAMKALEAGLTTAPE